MFKDPIDRILLRGTLLLLVLAGPASVVLTVVAFFRDRSVYRTTHNAEFAMRIPGFLGDPLPGTTASARGDLDVSIEKPSAWLWWLDALPDLLTAVTITIVAWILLRLVLDTYVGKPFVAKSASGLRTIAFVLVVAAFAIPISSAVGETQILRRVFPQAEPTFDSSWNIMTTTLAWLLVAVLVLAIAEAFRIGNRLAEDVEGLV